MDDEDRTKIGERLKLVNNHERNYSTIEKLLVKFWAVAYFRSFTYLEESSSFKQIINTNPRFQRWLVQLGEYNMKI